MVGQPKQLSDLNRIEANVRIGGTLAAGLPRCLIGFAVTMTGSTRI
jgi:hypothetical protein